MFETVAVIRQNCPGLVIDAIKDLGEGDFCRAFLLNRKLVFRFSKHEKARQSLKRENCLLPQIAPLLSLRIPLPVAASLDGAAEKSFIAYEFLPDKALTRDEYLKLDEATRTQCARAVARFLSELHAIDPQTAVGCGVPAIDYPENYAALLAEVRENFPGRIESSAADFAENELMKFLDAAQSEDFQPVLLHGDLSPDHVLYDGARVTSIIDFGDLMIGDAAWDFLWIYEDYGLDFFGRAVAEYAVEDKPKFIDRVRRLSVIEGIRWISECLSSGDEKELSEALKTIEI